MSEAFELVESGGGALEQISRAEIDIQIATAKKYPRTLSKVREHVLELATMDEETAKECFFSLPRGGKSITGESVRLAEILATSYGNLKAAWRPVSVDRVNGTVTCQGVCHDLERNVATSLEKTRKIEKRRGAAHYDQDMITLAINACGAIAYRDAVFKVVPKALIRPILAQIKDTARGKGTLSEKIDRVMKRLFELTKDDGIKQEWILAAVDARKIDDIDLAKLDELIGFGTAIKQGEIRPKDAFPEPGVATAEGGRDLFSKRSKADKKTEAQPEQPEKTADAEEAKAGEPKEEEVDVVDSAILEVLEGKMLDAQVSDAKLLKRVVAAGLADKDARSVLTLPAKAMAAVIERWDELLEKGEK